MKKDKKFEERVKEKWATNVNNFRIASDPSKITIGKILNPFYNLRTGAEPTIEQARTQVTNELKENFKSYRDKVINKWNERGLNVSTEYAAIPGGGGVTSKTLSFIGSSNVKGEDADLMTEDLLGKIKSLSGGDDLIVSAGINRPEGKKNGSTELKQLIQNGTLSDELIRSIKLGKDATLKDYRLDISMVGSNDPNYHAYTIKFNTEFLDKLQPSTEKKTGALSIDQAAKLRDGLTIYIKKDKDNTLARSKFTMSEIDILVNINPQGVLKKEVIPSAGPNDPGYTVTIMQNPIDDSYKLKTTNLMFDVETKKEVPIEREITVQKGTDLSTFYYNMVANLRNIYTNNRVLKEAYMKEYGSQNKPTTREELDQLKAQILNRQ